MKRSLLWFKTDLRLHDNETLVRAVEQSDEVIPVYCFDEAQFEKTAFGFRKTGKFRMKFLLESLADLDSSLRKLGSGLVITRGRPEIELFKLARIFGASKIFAKREVAFEEKQTDERVEKEVWKMQCSFETFSTSTLYHAQDLPFSIKDIPEVFTNFKRQVERESAIRPVFETPAQIKSPFIEAMQLPKPEEFGFEAVQPDPRAVMNFSGGEKEGYRRLNDYFFTTGNIAAYKETRNGMIGADYSSKFSPWLALGCLSPKEIFQELKRYESMFGSNESTYWLVYELLWRDYFRFMMKKHRHEFFLFSGISSIKKEALVLDKKVLQSWVNGKTKDDFINANMIELKQTGFMSNRGRQNVASYLCNDLKTDWRYGAAYFEQQLIDYDVCSNWGNWAYLAGVGNDPRPGRYFSPEKQAKAYDPKNAYRALWLNKLTK